MSASNPYCPPRSRGGFTLIEILVVISIIAILAAIITPAYFAVRRTVFEGAIASDLAQMEGSLEKFKDEFGFYPPDFSEFVAANGTPLNYTDVIPNFGGDTVQSRLLQFLAKISPTHDEQAQEPTTLPAPYNALVNSRLAHWWENVGKRLATDITVTTTTKEARLRGPQYALWFWLSQLHNDAQYPLTGQRLGTTSVDSDSDGIEDWEDFTSQREVLYDFQGAQLEQVSLLLYPLTTTTNGYAIYRPIQRGGKSPVVYFHHNTYLENVGNSALVSTAIDFFPGSAVPNIAKPVRVPGTALPSGTFENPSAFQIIVSGWDESFGEVNSGNYASQDNLTNFSKGRLDAYVENFQNP